MGLLFYLQPKVNAKRLSRKRQKVRGNTEAGYVLKEESIKSLSGRDCAT